MHEIPGSNPTQGTKDLLTFRQTSFFLLFQNTIFYHKKLPLLKHILALPTWGQKWTQTELQPFEIGNFDLGHPLKDVMLFVEFEFLFLEQLQFVLKRS